MKLSTAAHLAALNQRFYADHAENFADARPRLPAGVQRILAGVSPGARVLEVGCGDGKVGRALARSGVGAYLGLDASEAMLAKAEELTKDERRRTNDQQVLRPAQRSFDFKYSDLSSSSWPQVLPPSPFDWILAFAVFHHLPGYELRAGVLQTLADHLAPGGRLALSNWQFTRSDRLKKLIVSWSQAGLSDHDVEPGDYLLSWERKGARGLRYVHLLDAAETGRMASKAGLRVVDSFRADGLTDDLTDYVVLELAG